MVGSLTPGAWTVGRICQDWADGATGIARMVSLTPGAWTVGRICQDWADGAHVGGDQGSHASARAAHRRWRRRRCDGRKRVRSPNTTAVRAVVRCVGDRKTARWRRMTALLFAAQNGHARVVELLIAAGADIVATHRAGYTPMADASASGRKSPTVRFAGSLRSCWRRSTVICKWSSTSSPPAPTSPPRPTTGRELGQVVRRVGHCADDDLVRQADCAHVGNVPWSHRCRRRTHRRRCGYHRNGRPRVR